MAGRPPTKEAPPFGRRLSAARRERGLSQRELADQLSITRELVDYYERRAVNPSIGFVERAAEVLGVSVAELLGVPAQLARKKPGPVSQLDQRVERIKRLPRKEQEFILKFLDTVLERAEAS